MEKSFTFDETIYVQLTSLKNKMLIFKFEAPQDILKEGAEFFSTSNTYEPDQKRIFGETEEIPLLYEKPIHLLIDRDPIKTNGEHLNGIFPHLPPSSK